MNLPEIVNAKLISLGADLEDAFLVAVSGGADSTALLLAMKAVMGSSENLTVAHLDHGVRSGSSRDLKKVVELCDTLEVKSVTGSLDPDEVKAYRYQHGSLEAGMRLLRYRFLFEAAKKSGSKWIVTGHTSDDQVETILFRVTRGMDWRSLDGIPARRGMILRPIIDVPRTATLSYCGFMGVSAVADPTNADETYARNRIRNRILPGLAKEFHPDISDLLHRMSSTSRHLASAESKMLEALLPGSGNDSPGWIDRDVMLALPGILQKRMIVDQLVPILQEYPSANLVDDIRSYILAGRNGQLSLPGGLVLTLSYGSVHIRNISGTEEAGHLPTTALELKIPGCLVMPDAGITITVRESALDNPGSYPCGNTTLLSKRRVTGPLWVRKRHSGDRFMPIGMNRKKKLKDFLVDRKIPGATRDLIPIVLDGEGDIIWVGGIEISQKVALDGVKGEEAIQIQIEDLSSDGQTIGNDRDRSPQNQG